VKVKREMRKIKEINEYGKEIIVDEKINKLDY
jgi:hypothetical protein